MGNSDIALKVFNEEHWLKGNVQALEGENIGQRPSGLVWQIRDFSWMKIPPYLDNPFSKGWGNGYVGLPKGHPCYGLHYDEINKRIDVHGGLTLSDEIMGYWVIGFDTCHYADTKENWPREAVLAETMKLVEEMERILEEGK
jgi:hypothetical protein